MAYKRRYRRYRGSVGDEMQRGLTQLVTLAISLYAFDILLDAIMPLVNTSTWFATAISFIEALLPVVGILGAYKIIKNVLKNVNK